MFVESVKHLTMTTKYPIVSINKNSTGNFVALLTERELRILNSLNLSESLAVYNLENQEFQACGKFLYAFWNQEASITILTEKSYFFYLKLNESGVIINADHVKLADPVIASTNTKDYSAYVTSNSKILAFSHSGHFLGSVTIDKSIKMDVKDIRFLDNVIFLVFEDGSVCTANVKFSDVFEEQEIKLAKMRYNNVKGIEVSANQNAISLLHSNGMVSLISKSMPNAVEVKACRNCVAQVWSTHGNHLFTLSREGELTIIRTSDLTRTTTKIGMRVTPGNFSLSYDEHFSTIFFSNADDLTIAYLAITDRYTPSLTFHTCNKVIFAKNWHKIDGPKELIAKGFTIQHCASSPDQQHVIIAGKRGFAGYDMEKGAWHFSNDRIHKCHSIWYQCDIFCAILQDFKTNKWKIGTIAADTFQIIEVLPITDQVLYVTRHQSRVLVATRKNVITFLITNKRIKQLNQYPASGKVISAAFIDQNNTIVVHVDNQLRVLPSNSVFKHDVISMTPSIYSYLIFVHTADKTEIFFNTKWVQFDIVPLILDGVFAYHLPKDYDIGSMHIKRHSYVARVLKILEDSSDNMFSFSFNYMRFEYILIELVKAYKSSIDDGYGDTYMEFLSKVEPIKNHVLVAALILLQSKYHPEIIKHLPNLTVLQKKFSHYRDKIISLYGRLDSTKDN